MPIILKNNLLHQIRCTFDVHLYQLTHHALSKEMTADATLEALEGTSFKGLRQNGDLTICFGTLYYIYSSSIMFATV